MEFYICEPLASIFPSGYKSQNKVIYLDNVSLRIESIAPDAGLFQGPETAVDSTTPAPPLSPDGWHDIDDFLETAPHLRLA